MIRFLVGSLFVMRLAVGQPHLPETKRFELPYGPVTRLASPDGTLVLYRVPYQSGVNEGPQLWIENERTYQRQKLFDVSDTLTAVWSPDGTAFSVVNHSASDITESYIYDAKTLQRLVLSEVIFNSGPALKRFAAGHHYWDLERWEDPQTVIVHFYGHTDQPPVICFDSSYRVTRSGTVTRLDQHTFSPDSKSCKG